VRRRFVLAACAGALLSPGGAQGQRAVTLRADNDAFNFWQMPWVRTDEEYTSGVQAGLVYDGAAGWGRRWARGGRACGASAANCVSHSYTLGQDIYTGERLKGRPQAIPGERPDAGVLWIAARQRTSGQRTTTDLGFTLGVIGKPSLAEDMQRLFHTIAPRLNRPITWGRQMPAEPVFAIALDHSRRWGAGALQLQPHAGASFGTLLTEARAGAGARLERTFTLPFKRAVLAGPFSIALASDAQLRAVARNAALSGAFFRKGPSVELRPLVTEYAGGLHLGWRTLDASWTAHSTSAEHVGRRAPHSWSTLALTWRALR
jgi:hypothetical protein